MRHSDNVSNVWYYSRGINWDKTSHPCPNFNGLHVQIDEVCDEAQPQQPSWLLSTQQHRTPYPLDKSRCMISVSPLKPSGCMNVFSPLWEVLTWNYQTAKMMNPNSTAPWCVCVCLFVGGKRKRTSNQNNSSITNIWWIGLLRWLSVPILFQIYGNITVLALAAHLSKCEAYLFALKLDGTSMPCCPPGLELLTLFLYVPPLCLNIIICSCKMV